LFFFLGVNSPGAEDSPTNHSSYFYVDDSALTNGLKAFVNLVEDFYTKTKSLTTRWPDPAESKVDLDFPRND